MHNGSIVLFKSDLDLSVEYSTPIGGEISRSPVFTDAMWRLCGKVGTVSGYADGGPMYAETRFNIREFPGYTIAGWMIDAVFDNRDEFIRYYFDRGQPTPEWINTANTNHSYHLSDATGALHRASSMLREEAVRSLDTGRLATHLGEIDHKHQNFGKCLTVDGVDYYVSDNLCEYLSTQCRGSSKARANLFINGSPMYARKALLKFLEDYTEKHCALIPDDQSLANQLHSSQGSVEQSASLDAREMLRRYREGGTTLETRVQDSVTYTVSYADSSSTSTINTSSTPF